MEAATNNASTATLMERILYVSFTSVSKEALDVVVRCLHRPITCWVRARRYWF